MKILRMVLNKKLSALLGLVIVWSGCATTGFNSSTGVGFIYSGFTEPVSSTASNKVTKAGKACASNILGIVSTGDASIEAARRAGRITTISSVDKEFSNILMVYGTTCTIVRGD